MASKQFEIDIDKFIKKAGDRADAFMLVYTQDIAEKVIENSPVDLGYFRASWDADIGGISLFERERIPRDQGISGGQAQAEAFNRISLKLKNVKAGDIVYIHNNVRYGEALEDGRSQQQPLGIGRKVVEPVITILAEPLAKAALARVGR